MMQQKRSYRERSRDFLVKAREELAAGDPEQASEKAWGAAATIMKAFADRTGESYERHSDVYAVINAVVRESGDPEMREMFKTAAYLHTNFYEDSMTAEDIDKDIGIVERFVEKVEALL